MVQLGSLVVVVMQLGSSVVVVVNACECDVVVLGGVSGKGCWGW